MNQELVREIRKYELSRVRPWFPQGRLLELGAGAGWQAKELQEAGFEVEAIDLISSGYRDLRVFPVREYDGESIPFPDQSFDCVFSSNVLEHIPHVEVFQSEIARVLKPGGCAVHVLPSSSWRLATTATHFPGLFKRLVLRLTGIERPRSERESAGLQPRARPSLWKRVMPQRHGELGNVWTEVYWFSRRRWTDLFRRTGWRVSEVEPMRLRYSGNLLLGPLLPISARRLLSYIAGSSGVAYRLERE